MFYHLFEILIPLTFVLVDEIVAHPRSNKRFFDSPHFPKSAKEIDNTGVIHFHRFAQMGVIDAPLMVTRTVFKFFVTLIAVHICRGASDVTDNPFEIFVLGKLRCFR